jgi:uncharacterized RDD family membrane protein YckC
MQLVCGKCNQVLEFSGQRPSFCAYCGQPLSEHTITTPSDPSEAPTVAPASPSTEPTVPGIPQTLGGYRLLRELGAGGMGAVYEAEEIASGRRVALKVIAPEFATSAETVERFRQEGRLASMVVHPRCVFVLAVDEDAGRPYIVMELMPGSTLKDLVDEHGPLPPDQALAKILDVIEGLQEAHRLEVIHRDVKPSNCFLDAQGRVKVGDFGLAKSLVSEGHLTRTGTFLGTLLFASPEQIRSEAIDPRTDVYSVAATLYYLLTGRAPFQSSDAAATLARIVSDPAPPMRSVHPELPPALDRVVLRGLERDRENRWQDLEEFRQALLALVPNPLTLSDLGVRTLAYLIDAALFWLLAQAILLLGAVLIAEETSSHETTVHRLGWLMSLALFMVYFTALEAIWGYSLGKALWRLRVCMVSGTDPPAAGRSALRSVLFCGLLHLGILVGGWVAWVWLAVGLGVMLSTMRAANGYRGLHEVLTGTRVVRLPWPRQKQPLLSTGGWLLYFLGKRPLSQGMPQATGLPERIGGFALRGTLKWTPEEKIVLGEDAASGRKVFIWLRPLSAPPLDQTRREVGRRTRLRWLACGRQGDLQWDAILAPSGCPLPELIHSEGKLTWPELRPLVVELTEELAAACAEGSLPRSLVVGQIWVQAESHIQLADTALGETASELTGQSAGTDQERALTLLRQAVLLALEGSPRPPLDRLVREQERYETLQQWQADLSAAQG